MHAGQTKRRQMLFNLLSNAARLTERGQIELKVASPDGLKLVMSGALRLVMQLLICALTACAQVGPGAPSGEGPMPEKIRLDLSGLREDGLYGPPDGLRALAYEFCIPARQE